MYSDVNKKIDYAVFTNNEGKVTANNLNSVLHDIVDVTDEGKQDRLVSGTNIKTVNGVDILGKGDISLPVDDVMLSTSTNPVQNCVVKEYIDSIDERNKGYYSSLESLNKQHPNPRKGSKAYVGLNYPYEIYVYDGEWEFTGETGGAEDIPLGEYYTKDNTDAWFVKKETLKDYSTTEQVNDIINDTYEVLSIDEYENLAHKENKLYFCFE